MKVLLAFVGLLLACATLVVAEGYEGPARLEIAAGPLALVLDVAPDGLKHTYTVTDSRSGQGWEAQGGDDTGFILQAEKTSPASLRLLFRHCQTESRFWCAVSLSAEGVLSFTIEAEDPQADFAWLNYPPVFHAQLNDGALLFCDRSSGALIPQSDETYRGKTLMCYGNTNALDQPFVGMVDLSTGAGCALMLETPYDVVVRFEPDADSKSWPRVIWISSLGKLAYPRTVSYRFSPEGGYVALAKLYRDWAAGQGQLVPLTERAKTRPKLDWLAGACLVWGSDGLRFAEEARARGVARAIVYGRFPPEEIRKLTDLGFLTGEYDNYVDLLEGPPGITRGNIEKESYRAPDGKARTGWLTLKGLQYYQRSSSQSVAAAEAYVPDLLARWPFTLRFIDVSPAVDLVEDYHPDHTFDRRQDADYRRELLSWMQQKGLVVGGEHAKAWTQPYVDYAEGTMSGSFWWEYDAGHLVRIKSRDQFPSRYLDYGVNPRVRIPLYELLYHDCLVSTWYWGDSSGYAYDIAPELSDFKDISNILYGTPPLMWANELGYGWDRERQRFLQTYRLTCKWHEAVAFTQLENHEFLSEDRLLQRTRFSSGATAVVNYDSKPRNYEDVTLAPYGFLAEGPDIRESRLMEDGAPLTRVEAPGFLFVQTAVARAAGPFEGKGDFAAFLNAAGNWQLHVVAEGPWRLRPGDLPEAPSSARALRLGSRGERLALAECSEANGVVTFPAAEGEQLFELAPLAYDEVLVLPGSGEVEAGTEVSVISAPGAEVRYTTDGTAPTADSPLWEGPISLGQSLTLKARAFRPGLPPGPVVEAQWTVSKVLFESGVIRGGEPAFNLALDLSGVQELRLEVGQAGDGGEYDSFALGDPQFVANEGAVTRLSDLPAKLAVQSGGATPALGLGALKIGGQQAQWAAKLDAPARLVYELGGRFSHFEALAGIDDWTEGRGSVTLKITAIY